MPHTRIRHISAQIAKSAAFWPVVGLLGPRQSGKSTLFRDLLKLGPYVTMDDRDTLEDVLSSEKNFLLKLARPLIIDEAQKAPRLFDAIKLMVDRKKRPGSYFLTGSSQFSSKVGIRESLTGRIGLHYLYPMTLAEAHQKPFEEKRAQPWHGLKERFSLESAYAQFSTGGLPSPLFVRDREKIKNYFQGWIETTVLRDVMRVFGRNYDPDMAFAILDQFVRTLRDGDYPTLKHFKQNSRVLRRYLEAFEEVFLIQKTPAHAGAVGSDVWTLTDTGFLHFATQTMVGDGLEQSLARIFCMKEIKALCEYAGNRQRFTYFKTARGSPVDFIWGDVCVKISQLPLSRIEYDLRPMRSALKALSLKKGIVLTATESCEEIKEKGQTIRIVPWTHFS